MAAAPFSDLSNSLMGHQCSVEKREANWNFIFGEHLNIAASVPWRIVTSDGIAHGDEDDGQWFGRPQPVDGEVRANELLRERTVVGVDVS